MTAPQTFAWAKFSPDRCYRYELGRLWDDTLPSLVVIGLNPSTADEAEDDPTIRRCMGFARGFGCGSLIMLNLFAWRATDPRELRRVPHPIGIDNDSHILRAGVFWPPAIIVAAWGVHGALYGRAREVRRLLRTEDVHHLGLTKDGHPRHPLYLRADTPLTPWPWRAP